MTGARAISPIWIRPAFGQLFRGGIDYRSYLSQLILWGLFKAREGDVTLAQALWIYRHAQVVYESHPIFPESPDEGLSNRPRITVFRGLDGLFAPLSGWSGWLHHELRAICRDRYLRVVDNIPSVPIGICVRCGNDFRSPPLGCYSLGEAEKTPIEWFVRTLGLIREAAGAEVPAYVVSDGTPNQLRSLLAMKQVTFVRPGSAISDLLILAKSQLLLASGASSFAAWGAFLGQMPTLSHRGQSMDTLWRLQSDRGQYVGSFDPIDPDPNVMGEVVLRFK